MRLAFVVAVAWSVSLVPPLWAADAVFGGRIPCADRDGVRFCEGDVTRRVETWDGVPLDANVTLPPASLAPPYPLIIDEHGWSLGKAAGPFVERALAGYAVLSYSARGFHQSCGFPASRAPDPSLENPTACDHGWTHLGDARYEVRDSQHLAGLLADEGWAIPDKVGITGVSYGGGRALIAAALRDRVMLPDGTLVPWQSPGGLPMTIAAAAPLIPWSDLPASLVPNGATLDYRADNPYGTRGGVRKDQWNDLLFAVGAGTGYYAPPGADPGADLTGWNERTQLGEPYDNDSATPAMIDELATYHSAYYVDDSIPPAPLFVYNAWTDDLFPANEGLRFWLKTRDRHPSAEISVLFADDFGHPRARLDVPDSIVPARVTQFFDRHLRGMGPALPTFEVFTQGCRGAEPLGPFTSSTWAGLHLGEVFYTSDDPQAFDQDGGDPAVAAALAPLAGGSCRTVAAATNPGAATYVLPPAGNDGYTLVGSPTVIAELVVTGAEFAQVAARLWDVAPDGMQTLVSHGFYRPRGDNLGPQVFQLPPSGWFFAAEHTPKLELLGQSVPAGRASAGRFTVTVASLELRLPVREHPHAPGQRIPAPPVYPPEEVEPLACGRAPQAACLPATKAALALVRGKRASKDRLAWSWEGDGGFSPPAVVGERGTVLCMWDAGGLVASSAAPDAGTCGKKACWKASDRRMRYRDKKATRTGTRAAAVEDGTKGGAATVAGRGARLGNPPLPIDALPLTVQLLGSDGTCLESTFGEAQTNDERRLKAKLRP